MLFSGRYCSHIWISGGYTIRATCFGLPEDFPLEYSSQPNACYDYGAWLQTRDLSAWRPTITWSEAHTARLALRSAALDVVCCENYLGVAPHQLKQNVDAALLRDGFDLSKLVHKRTGNHPYLVANRELRGRLQLAVFKHLGLHRGNEVRTNLCRASCIERNKSRNAVG